MWHEFSRKKVSGGHLAALFWRPCAGFWVPVGNDKGGTGVKIPGCAQVANTGPELDRSRWRSAFRSG